MANIRCGHCHNLHHSVQEVRECGLPKAVVVEAQAQVGTDKFNQEWAEYKNQNARLEAEAERRAMQAKTDRDNRSNGLATPRQIKLMRTLQQERGVPISPEEKLAQMGFTQAKADIARLIAMPRNAKVQPQHRHEPEDGIYVYDEEGAQVIFKVYKMVHGSGRQGLKRLQPITDGSRKGQFRYVGLAVKNLPHHARKMTIEEAKEFGKLYGFCVVCGRTLTDEISIANGIGPICGGRW